MTDRGGTSADVGQSSTVVRFPGRSARQRRLRRWASVAVALVGALVVAWVLFLSPVLAVDHVEVTGTTLVDGAEVERRLDPVLGTPLPRVGTERVTALVADTPGVDSVRAAALPPTGLEVVVEEAAPVASAAGEDALDVLVGDGSVLRGVAPEALDAAADGAVVPTAGEGLLDQDGPVRRAVADVVESLPADLRERTSAVDAEVEEQVRLTLDDGLVVVWGDASEPERKAAVVRAFLGEQDVLEDVTELDVSVVDRPLTR